MQTLQMPRRRTPRQKTARKRIRPFIGKYPLPKRPDLDYQSSHAELTTQQPSPTTPLAIILEAMRSKYAVNDIDGAVALARIAAPYLHPRVRTATPATELAAMPDADLDSLKTQK
jgi:hypothetical protein